jgi:hypothetical protein
MSISATAFANAAQYVALQASPYAPVGSGGSPRVRRMRRRRVRWIAAPRFWVPTPSK